MDTRGGNTWHTRQRTDTYQSSRLYLIKKQFSTNSTGYLPFSVHLDLVKFWNESTLALFCLCCVRSSALLFLKALSVIIKSKIRRQYCWLRGWQCTGTSQKIRIWWKSSFFLLFIVLISKSETFIYFRFITCKVKHFKGCFVLILMIRAYSSWK